VKRRCLGSRLVLVMVAALGCAAGWGETQRERLAEGWRFRLEGEQNWRAVTVPHDWSIEYPTDPRNPSSGHGGYFRCGKGEYELERNFAADETGGNWSLDFEGVYRDATVYWNGEQVAKGPLYGYTWFRVDLRGRVKAGRNTLKVTVDNSLQPNCRWYSGSGIFRHVWLERRDNEYIVPDTTSIRFADVGENSAQVVITGTLTNVVEATAKTVSREFRIEKPILWSPENPHLYTTEFYGERLRYGIRTVGWDGEGFKLNGKRIMLHGACVHHDHGPLGAASHDAAERRKVRQLKAAGFNAVRTSHAPVSIAFLDACDEEGLLVMNDMFDTWRKRKTTGDYHRVFASRWESDLRMILARDRNHPSVVMWSIGNEIHEAGSPWTAEQAERMVKICHELSPELPVTQAICSPGRRSSWSTVDGLAAKLDVVGYNYQEDEVAADHERLPERRMVLTETFPKDVVKVWRVCQSNSYCYGEFVWTGIDYLGEAAIGDWGYEGVDEVRGHGGKQSHFPWHGGWCGDIDLTGWRKPISHQRETLWNENAPTYLAVREPSGWKGKLKDTLWSPFVAWESWTYHGWEGKPITAEVYTRKPKVRLRLNGRIVGEKPVSAESAWTAVFTLPYEPGELTAEALDADGKVVETSTLRTAGAMAGIRYAKERIGDIEWVTAEVVDKDGNVCPDAEVTVNFGDFGGEVLATCSGDLRDQVPATSASRRTWHGRAMAVRRIDTKKGK